MADLLLVALLVPAAVQLINPTSGGMLALRAVLVPLLAATTTTTTSRQSRLLPAGARRPLVVQGSLLISLLVALVGRAMAPAFDNQFGQLIVAGFALLVLACAASSRPRKRRLVVPMGGALSVLPYLATALVVCGVAARVATGHLVGAVADVFFPILLWLLVQGRHAVSVGEDSYLSGELRRSEEHFRTLVQDSSHVVILLDYHLSVRWASRAARTVLGLDSVILTGQLFQERVHPVDG